MLKSNRCPYCGRRNCLIDHEKKTVEKADSHEVVRKALKGKETK